MIYQKYYHKFTLLFSLQLADKRRERVESQPPQKIMKNQLPKQQKNIGRNSKQTVVRDMYVYIHYGNYMHVDNSSEMCSLYNVFMYT